MTPEQRRAILGDETIAHIHALVDATPEPPPELIEELRRIFARPGRRLEQQVGGGSRLGPASAAADSPARG